MVIEWVDASNKRSQLGIHLALTSIIKFASMKVREISRAEKSKPRV